MSDSSHAVFISYASQDAEAAQKICEALRAAGIEVFLDQSELRGGDAWDQKIRREIHDCALFIPIVSEHTQERLEGYFRHEWKLAIERIHHMAEQKPFLMPVVVDGTRDQEAFVPDAFRAVQWTRLPGGETPPAFAARIKRLLSPELSPLSAVSGATQGLRVPVRATWRSKPVLLAIVVVVCAALAYFVADRFWISSHPTPAHAAFAPPPHSIAVLPFVNLSGDKEQEYFSDGLTEEILNSLARINELQVSARTSSFSFKGEKVDLGTIARKLNVGAILEGSVRRSGETIRITAQLNNSVTGFHLWSQTYDRKLSDVLKLQTEIATAVASALQVRLRLATPRSVDPGAYEAYLKGRYYWNKRTAEGMQKAEVYFRQAIDKDPSYGVAYSGLADCNSGLAWHGFTSPSETLPRAHAAALKAIEIDPQSAEAHASLGLVLDHEWDWSGAEAEFKRALQLDRRYANAHHWYGDNLSIRGRHDEALLEARKASNLDPLNLMIGTWLGLRYYLARNYESAIEQGRNTVDLDPNFAASHLLLGEAYVQKGFREKGLAELQSAASLSGDNPLYLAQVAVAYASMGRRTEALQIVDQLQTTSASRYVSPYGLAQIYAVLKDKEQTFKWLQVSYDGRAVWMSYLAVDPVFDGYRSDQRFQDLLRRVHLLH